MIYRSPPSADGCCSSALELKYRDNGKRDVRSRDNQNKDEHSCEEFFHGKPFNRAGFRRDQTCASRTDTHLLKNSDRNDE